MNLRRLHGGGAFESGVRITRDGKHVGNVKLSRLHDGTFDLTVNSTSTGISVSAAVELSAEQLLAVVEHAQEAIKHPSDDIDTPPTGAA